MQRLARVLKRSDLLVDLLNVPLGFVSLTENVMMVAMALWMLFGAQAMSATM